MRSPRRVCSKGSSQTAHSLPINVLSRRVRDLSRSSTPAIPLLERGAEGECADLLLDECEAEGFAVSVENWEERERGRKPG